MRYHYQFTVWPDETWGHEESLYVLFECLASRIEVDFGPEEFESFRSSLSRQGFTLREIERVPAIDPEPVY